MKPAFHCPRSACCLQEPNHAHAAVLLRKIAHRPTVPKCSDPSTTWMPELTARHACPAYYKKTQVLQVPQTSPVGCRRKREGGERSQTRLAARVSERGGGAAKIREAKMRQSLTAAGCSPSASPSPACARAGCRRPCAPHPAAAPAPRASAPSLQNRHDCCRAPRTCCRSLGAPLGPAVRADLVQSGRLPAMSTTTVSTGPRHCYQAQSATAHTDG